MPQHIQLVDCLAVAKLINSNKTEIAFLDTTVFRNQNNTLGVRPFKKPTDRNTFLRCWGTEYSLGAYQIKRIIEKHWHLVREIPRRAYPPLVGFRRTKTFKNSLIRTDVLPAPERISSLPSGHFKCGPCKICRMAWEGNKFQVNNYEIVLKSFTTCATEGTVYLWRCPCPQYYVGKTTCCR